MKKRRLSHPELLDLAKRIYVDLRNYYGPAVKTRPDKVRVLAEIMLVGKLTNCYRFSKAAALAAAEEIVEKEV